MTDGAARVAALGLGHTASYLVGAVILGLDVRRRVAGRIWDADLARAVVVAVAVGARDMGGRARLGSARPGSRDRDARDRSRRRARGVPCQRARAAGRQARGARIVTRRRLAGVGRRAECWCSWCWPSWSTPTSAAAIEPVDRLLIVTLPEVSWSDLEAADLPRSTVSWPRPRSRTSRPASGESPPRWPTRDPTMGAGTRATTLDPGSVFEVDEPYGDASAGTVFAVGGSVRIRPGSSCTSISQRCAGRMPAPTMTPSPARSVTSWPSTTSNAP